MDVTVAPEIIITQYLVIYRRMVPIPPKFRVFSRFPLMQKAPARLRAQDQSMKDQVKRQCENMRRR